MQGLCVLLGPPGLRELHMQHKRGKGALLLEMVVLLMPHSPEVLLGSPYESLSDVGESRVWFASKNLTPCRMH